MYILQNSLVLKLRVIEIILVTILLSGFASFTVYTSLETQGQLDVGESSL